MHKKQIEKYWGKISLILEEASIMLKEEVEGPMKFEREEYLRKQREYYLAHTGNSAALIIDMQEDFLGDTCNLERLISAQCKTMSYFANNDLPVVVITYQNHGSIIPQIREKVALCKNSVSIVKQYDSSFYKTNLKDVLKRANISNLLLMGVNANSCIKEAAGGAIERGFKIMTASDLISDGYDEINYKPAYEKHGIWSNNHVDLLRIIHKEKYLAVSKPKPRLSVPSRQFL